ncbi:MAG: hypothetical protein M9915_01480 [Rhizobacter sp.]|jgi:hypothetical protein|nr:hypothetical protein [Rhizobacter sp.]
MNDPFTNEYEAGGARRRVHQEHLRPRTLAPPGDRGEQRAGQAKKQARGKQAQDIGQRQLH